MPLNYKQARFVIEYCIDQNATQAYIRAGYSPDGAGQAGHRLLKNAEIKAAIEKRMEDIAIAASVTPEMIVAEWKKIAFGNGNELVQVRRVNCRYCNGVDHRYQWTEPEYLDAVDKATAADKPLPDASGWFGFDLYADPHPECPQCKGHGVAEVYAVDTRKAKSSLYVSAERTRSGIKINTRDKDAALYNLSRYLGMQAEKKEHEASGDADLLKKIADMLPP